MQTRAQSTSSIVLTDVAALLARVGLAALFLWSGYGKLVHMDGNVGYMTAFHVPAADVLIWLALLVELVAGAMVVLGWKVRWATAALLIFTVPATLVFHAYWGVPADQALNQQIHFMKNLAILGGLLSVFAHGSGRYSIDRR
jgi:putative oxidoreductase